MVTLMNEISESDIERYNNDGAVALRGIFDEAWLERIALAIQDDIREPGWMVANAGDIRSGIPAMM